MELLEKLIRFINDFTGYWWIWGIAIVPISIGTYLGYLKMTRKHIEILMVVTSMIAGVLFIVTYLVNTRLDKLQEELSVLKQDVGPQKAEPIRLTGLMRALNNSLVGSEHSVYVTSIRTMPEDSLGNAAYEAREWYHSLSYWAEEPNHRLVRIIATPNAQMKKWFLEECKKLEGNEQRYALRSIPWDGKVAMQNVVVFDRKITYLILSPSEENKVDDTQIFKITGKDFGDSMIRYFESLASTRTECLADNVIHQKFP